MHYPGTYVAGCYDRLISQVAGRSVDNEDLVNLPNWLPLTFRADGGDWPDPGHAEILIHRHQLDMRHGVLTRLLRVRDSRGQITRMRQRRLVSMDDPHLAALSTTIVAENWSGLLEVGSALDGRVTNCGVARYRELAHRHLTCVRAHDDGGGVIELLARTATSRVEIALAARTFLAGGRRRSDLHKDRVTDELEIEVKAGQEVTVEKVVALYTSRDRAIGDSASAARTAVERAGGFDELLDRHARAWERLWQRAHVTAEDGEVQQILNLYVFHLLQTASPHIAELDVGLPARGLHGEAYRGHVFWDELFVFPFLAPRFPEITRALLKYRWRRLPEARWAARAAGYAGAMFPWQSGSDGREETPRLHLNPALGPLAGRPLAPATPCRAGCGLQRLAALPGHRGHRFPGGFGGELLLEIARFFASLATDERRAIHDPRRDGPR